MPRTFVTRLDRLDAEIKAAADDTKRRRSLRRDREQHLCDFAKRMDESGIPSLTFQDGRIFTAIWDVKGFAPHRTNEARDWLASKGITWDGSSKSLRHEIAKLSEAGASLPVGAFGLHVSRTIKIQNGIPSQMSKRAFSQHDESEQGSEEAG